MCLHLDPPVHSHDPRSLVVIGGALTDPCSIAATACIAGLCGFMLQRSSAWLVSLILAVTGEGKLAAELSVSARFETRPLDA